MQCVLSLVQMPFDLVEVDDLAILRNYMNSSDLVLGTGLSVIPKDNPDDEDQRREKKQQ